MVIKCSRMHVTIIIIFAFNDAMVDTNGCLLLPYDKLLY